MKKILITGAAGFIGYHLTKHLLTEEENSLVLVDNLQRGKMDKNFEALVTQDHVKFVQADLTEQEFYQSLDKDFDQVYHLAAVNGTRLFYEIPHEVLRINTLTLVYILEWIKNLEKKPKLCFTSSNEAYAGGLIAYNKLPIPTPEDVPLVVEDTYNPRWSYGGSKLVGELFVINYAKAYDFSALIVRPHNFYGPRAGYDHVIPEFFLRIVDQVDPFPIYGSDDTRTFCYIDDAVRAMEMLVNSEKTNKQPIETVHIGDFKEIKILELLDIMFRVAGWKPSEIEKKEGKQGSVKRRLADVSKLQSLVNWQPEVLLGEGLKQTYEWYKEHSKK